MGPCGFPRELVGHPGAAGGRRRACRMTVIDVGEVVEELRGEVARRGGAGGGGEGAVTRLHTEVTTRGGGAAGARRVSTTMRCSQLSTRSSPSAATSLPRRSPTSVRCAH